MIKKQRSRLTEIGLTDVEEIDGDIHVLGWQLRCLHYGNTSEQTLDDHLREWNRSKPTRISETKQEAGTLVASKMSRPSVTGKHTKLPQKRQDLSKYFDAAKLTDTQRDYLSLKFEHEMSVTSIARLRGRHRSSVEETLKRAEAKLKSSPNRRHLSGQMRNRVEDHMLRRIDERSHKQMRRPGRSSSDGNEAGR